MTSRRYLVVLSTAILCYAALGTVLGILPEYVPSLGGGAILVGFAVGAPALTGATGRPLGGRFADHIGPARIVIAGALVMAAGTIPAFVESLPVLIVSRLAVGAGEAMMMAATVLWLLRLAGPERRGRAMGHVGLVALVVMAVGQGPRSRRSECSRLSRCRRADTAEPPARSSPISTPAWAWAARPSDSPRTLLTRPAGCLRRPGRCSRPRR